MSTTSRGRARNGGPAIDFESAWNSEPVPPSIDDYLPNPSDTRQATLIDLIRVDIAHRWLRAGLGKRLAEYCAEYPELALRDLPVGLIYDEFVIRRHSGHAVDPRTYLIEYPHHAAELDRLLNADEGTATFLADDSTQAAGTVAAPFDLDATATGLAANLTVPGTSEPLEEVDAGQHIDDFDLLTAIGSGAFARVFLARQRSMQRLVAVKVSEDHGSEPQTLAQLDHDYIVRVFDQRLLPDRKLRLLYMQYLPGGTLLGVLSRVRTTPVEERTGRLLLDAIDAAMEAKGEIRPSDSSVRAEIADLSWPETVAWLGRRLASALHHANARGVLHRDVKPANVLLTAEGIPKLADFNISFSTSTAGDSPVAYFGGSLSYMSPEQLAACHPGRAGTAADLDTRSDIYSLGVVLWELLTGRKPFDDTEVSGTDRTTLDAMLARRSSGVSADATNDLPADCPAALRRVLLSCLSSDPQRRWSTGKQLAQQLDLCLDARARNLVDPPPGSWRLRLRTWVVVTLTLASGIPNILAAVYNYQHNNALIVRRLLPDAQTRFELVAFGVNAIAWPVGFLIILWFCRNVIRVPAGLRKGKTYDAATLALTRRDTLLVGDRIVAVVFGLWVAAGFALPISLQLAAGFVPPRAYIHFVASIAVCGAIAVAYPFFLVSLYAVRSLYPALLTYGGTGAADAAALRGLDRRSNRYLAVAASVPLAGVAGLTFIPADEIPAVITAVRALCVGGILAFVGVYWLFRQLEDDLRALERVVSNGAESR